MKKDITQRSILAHALGFMLAAISPANVFPTEPYKFEAM